MSEIFGAGEYTYRAVEGWAKWPEDWNLHDVAAVGVDRNDNVYAFHRGDHPMVVFDRNGNVLRTWGEGTFKRAHGVHMAPDETIYLTDDADHTVRRCTLDGKVLLTIGIPGTPAPFMSGEPFRQCTHTALSPKGEIYVSDGYGNARVHKYTDNGKLVLSWGQPGAGPGEFNLPHNIACDADGWVYVADRENHRVQVFDGNGKFETEWHGLHRPSGMYMPPGKCPVCYVGEIGPYYDAQSRHAESRAARDDHVERRQGDRARRTRACGRHSVPASSSRRTVLPSIRAATCTSGKSATRRGRRCSRTRRSRDEYGHFKNTSEYKGPSGRSQESQEEVMSISSRRRTLVKAGAAFAGGAALGLPTLAAGQSAANWPSKPVRVIVPFGAGGTADIIGRIIAQQLSIQLGQPFVVENKGGASTTIGATEVFKQPADGYTLLMATPTFAVSQSVYPNLPFASKDFLPVAIFITTPLLLVVNPGTGFKTAGDYIKAAKANPGKISFASAGAGSSPHLAFELLMEQAGIELLHVPYKGGGEAVGSVLSSTTDSYFSVPIESGPHIRAGKLVALGSSGKKRTPSFPDVPTIAESGLPNFDTLHYTSMLVRTGTPQDIVNKLSENIQKAMKAPGGPRQAHAERRHRPGNARRGGRALREGIQDVAGRRAEGRHQADVTMTRR